MTTLQGVYKLKYIFESDGTFLVENPNNKDIFVLDISEIRKAVNACYPEHKVQNVMNVLTSSNLGIMVDFNPNKPRLISKVVKKEVYDIVNLELEAVSKLKNIEEIEEYEFKI